MGDPCNAFDADVLAVQGVRPKAEWWGCVQEITRANPVRSQAGQTRTLKPRVHSNTYTLSYWLQHCIATIPWPVFHESGAVLVFAEQLLCWVPLLDISMTLVIAR